MALISVPQGTLPSFCLHVISFTQAAIEERRLPLEHESVTCVFEKRALESFVAVDVLGLASCAIADLPECLVLCLAGGFVNLCLWE